MTDYIAIITALREKYKTMYNPLQSLSYREEICDALFGSLDLWLELADVLEELSQHKGMIWTAPVHARTREVFAKLRGKHD